MDRMQDDDLQEAAVLGVLTTRWVGRHYRYVAETGSTNDQLKAWVETGANDPPAGTVLLADYQSSGRGRLGRAWEAPRGSSLLFSVLLRPGWPAERAGWLVMLAGLAAAEAITATTGVAVGLKWPNDLMVATKGQWRKVGGLLVDSGLADGRVAQAIVGVGLNVNIPAADLPTAVTPPTSLLVATGQPVARRPLLCACLLHLEQWMERAERGHSPQPEWNGRLITIGEQVQATTPTGPLVEGLAEGTDEWGSLLVRDAVGKLHTVVAGDVSLRGR